MTDRLRLSCSEVDDLAALHVLDVLGAAEAAEVTAHLSDHGERHPSFAVLAGVTPFLAESIDPVAPPPELRARVMGAVAATPQAIASAPALPAPPVAAPAVFQAAAPAPRPVAPSYVTTPGWTQVPEAVTAAPETSGEPVSIDAARAQRARRSPLRAVLAAAAVLAIVVLGGWNVLLQQQDADNSRRMAMLAAAVTAAGQHGATVAPMSGSDMAAGAAGYAVFPPDGTGYIVLTGLPPLDAGQAWQAWTIADGPPVSAGMLTVGSDGMGVMGGVVPIPGTAVVALTVEPAGGSDAPTTSPVVVGELPAPLAGTGNDIAFVP